MPQRSKSTAVNYTDRKTAGGNALKRASYALVLVVVIGILAGSRSRFSEEVVMAPLREAPVAETREQDPLAIAVADRTAMNKDGYSTTLRKCMGSFELGADRASLCHQIRSCTELTDASQSYITSVGIKPLQIGGRCQVAHVVSMSASKEALHGWGDVFFARLDRQDGLYFIQPFVEDFLNGSYSVWAQCGMLFGDFVLSVWLDWRIRRDRWPSKDWPSATGFDRDATLARLTKTDFATFYEAVRQPVGGSGAIVNGYIGREGLPDWLTRLQPCDLGKKPEQSYCEPGAWIDVRKKSVEDACQQQYQVSNLSLLCQNLELLVPTSTFHHVYTESSCFYPLLSSAGYAECTGKRNIALIGDSTTEGQWDEIRHMWYGYHRKPNNHVFNLSDYCEYGYMFYSYAEQRKGIKRRGWVLKKEFDFKKGEKVLSYSSDQGGSIRYNQGWKRPMHNGIVLLTQRERRQILAKMLEPLDIAAVHSCGHDFGGPPGYSEVDKANRKKVILQDYQAGLKVLVEEALKWRKRKDSRRMLWVSCNHQNGGAFMSGNARVTHELNSIAKSLMEEHNFEYVDVTAAQFAASYTRGFGWWEDANGDFTGNIHHFEQECPGTLTYEACVFEWGRARRSGKSFERHIKKQRTWVHVQSINPSERSLHS